MGTDVSNTAQRVVVVSGLMRSGTSVLSEMLHMMGVPMGEMMRFPAHGGTPQLEWEDAAFSESLVSHMMGQGRSDLREFFARYLIHRSRWGGTWGVKSPFVLPFLSEFRSEAEALGLEIRLILTHREKSETLKSLEIRAAGMPRPQRRRLLHSLFEIQDRLDRWWEVYSREAEIFEMSDTREYPEATALRLRVIAGLPVEVEE